MKHIKKTTALVLSATMIISLSACSANTKENKTNVISSDVKKQEENMTETNLEQLDTQTNIENVNSQNQTINLQDQDIDLESLVFDNSLWNYDVENDVYWQIGVVYCAEPETTEYESLGIYVPGAYMTGAENSDGTYTCTINTEASIQGYTAQTAPIVMPINTAGYSAQSAPKSYSYNGLSSYLDAGFIYVYAGCRGRNNGYDSEGNLTYNGGAPWGVTDLKAAVRYLRYNNEILPGNTDRIFTFGHSGGGAQSSLMGATGDSELYFEYLNSIGAIMYDKDGNYISDAICGAMCWCPITSLDYANEAYEWMMGQYSSTGTRSNDSWTSALSDDLAAAFGEYINELGLMDENGTILTLSDTESGIYTSGTYYEYLLFEIERSFNNFLSDTSFPYTSSGNKIKADGGFAGGAENSQTKSDGEFPNGEMPIGNAEDIEDTGDLINKNRDGAGRGGMRENNSEQTSTVYKTVQDYINALNGEEEWITYDAVTNTASIISVEAFVTHCKNASKSVGAFDDLNRSQAENMVFGNNISDTLHFDLTMLSILEQNQEKYAKYSDWDVSYVENYQEAATNVDSLDTDSLTRQNMYNPMYYLSNYYKGYGTSTVAPHWRIHTGITQGDTASTVEMNLALALEQYDGVEDVDFEMVWGQGHTTAERTGNSTDNFISWVNDCIG